MTKGDELKGKIKTSTPVVIKLKSDVIAPEGLETKIQTSNSPVVIKLENKENQTPIVVKLDSGKRGPAGPKGDKGDKGDVGNVESLSIQEIDELLF